MELSRFESNAFLLKTSSVTIILFLNYSYASINSKREDPPGNPRSFAKDPNPAGQDLYKPKFPLGRACAQKSVPYLNCINKPIDDFKIIYKINDPSAKYVNLKKNLYYQLFLINYIICTWIINFVDYFKHICNQCYTEHLNVFLTRVYY